MFFTTCCVSTEPSSLGEDHEGFESQPVFGGLGEELADPNLAFGRRTAASTIPDKDLVTPLHRAASKGSAADIRKLVEGGADVGVLNEDGETPLHRAVYWGNEKAVGPLLEARSDVHAMDRKKKTPLRKAYENRAICEMLLSAGADPDSTDKHGDATLHRATEDGCADVVKALLDARAAPELKNSEGSTALHQAAEAGHLEVARLLLAARAPANAKSPDGETPLAIAQAKDHKDIADLLRESGG